MGSTVEQQPVGKLVQQSFGEAPRVKLSKLTQSKPNPICDRSGKPEDTERVFVEKGKTSRSQEIDDKRLHKELASSDRTGKPVKLSEDIRVNNLFLQNIVTLHHLTRTTSSTVQPTRRTLTLTFQEFRIRQ